LEFIKEGVSLVVMTKIGGVNRLKDSYKGFWRTARVGVSVVNALSNPLKSTVHSSDERFYEQEYEKGKRCIQ
jgi:DNA gyrase subunit B